MQCKCYIITIFKLISVNTQHCIQFDQGCKLRNLSHIHAKFQMQLNTYLSIINLTTMVAARYSSAALNFYTV
jgi:hypothetical protein